MSGEIQTRSRHEIQTTTLLAARLGQRCPGVAAQKIAETASKLYKIASSIYRSRDDADIVEMLTEKGQTLARGLGAHFQVSFVSEVVCYLSFNGNLERII